MELRRNPFLSCIWALSFKIIKFQPLILFFCVWVCVIIFGKKHAVFLAIFAEMYPFLKKIAQNWRVEPKIVTIVVT